MESAPTTRMVSPQPRGCANAFMRPLVEGSGRGGGQLERRRLVAYLRSVFTFALALTASCLTINAFGPSPLVSEVTGKLEYFLEHKDKIDAVFLGSSRIYQQVSPQLFDATLREGGHEIRSFNFGCSGMGILETSFILDRLLDSRPQRLQWVFIELGGVNLDRLPNEMATIREVYWHDAKRLGILWDQLRWRALREILPHVAIAARRYSNAGLFSERVRQIGKPTQRYTLGEGEDGYIPNPTPQIPAEMIPRLLGDLHGLRAELRENPVRQPEKSDAAIEFFKTMTSSVKARGAQAIYVGTPFPVRYPDFFATDPEPPPALYYDDADQFPGLYSFEHRADHHHLNRRGAEHFTRLLARDFQELLVNGRLK